MFDFDEDEDPVLRGVDFHIEDEEAMSDEIADTILGAVHNAGQDVQIFTGRDFETLPELMITDQLSEGEPGPGEIPAAYGTLGHSVVFSRSVPDIDRQYVEEGKIENKGDFLYSLAVEEMTHALQADQLGLKGFSGKAKKFVGKYVSRFNDMPSFDAEGFASWVSDQLSDFSKWDFRENQLLEVYNRSVDDIMEEAGMDVDSDYERWNVEKNLEKAAERPIEAYTGHAFYRALLEQNSFDEVIEEGFTPTRPGDIGYVLETIEESSVDPVLYDEVIEPYWTGGDIEWN
jgi:hypothetical protein